MKNMNWNKVILLILFFPLASYASEDYTECITKVLEILYNNSQEKRDLEEGFKYVKDKAPVTLVKAMEIALPTANALREGKLELRYVHSF